MTIHYTSGQEEWWIKAKLAGKEHPCPICRATGAQSHRLGLEYPGAKFPKLPCWHCAGTGDESAAIRRNIQGRRVMR